MRLRVRAFGLAVGIVWGLGIFIVTLWAMARGTGDTLVLLKSFYVGYGVSFRGAIMGLIWGYLDGVVCGASIAWLYNKLNKVLYKTEVV